MQQTAIRVTEAAFIGYPVLDMNRARHFYEKILHLTPAEEAMEGNWVEYDLKGTTFAIGQFEAWKPATDGPSLALEVADFDGAMAALRAENIAFLMDPMETPVCHMALVSDTEGNSLMIHQRKG